MKGLYPFELFQELSQFSMTLGLAFLFKNVKNFLIFGDFVHLTQFNIHKLWYPLTNLSFMLFYFLSLSYFVLAWTSALN